MYKHLLQANVVSTMRYPLAIIAVFFSLGVHSQCFTQNEAFQVGEKVNYEVYYNWGLIWLNAGEALFEVKEAQFKNKTVYHFFSTGRSKANYDWIFTVRERFESWVDPQTLKPIRFQKEVQEGGFKAKDVYRFDPDNNEVFTNIQNTKFSRQDTVKIGECTLDVLTMIYYTRNIDFSKAKDGDKIPISMLIEDQVYDLFIRYRGKENVKLKDGTTYACSKFSILLVEGTIFAGGEDMTVWVSDDKNRIPVLVEAKILVGSVKAYLSSAEGLKRPMMKPLSTSK